MEYREYKRRKKEIAAKNLPSVKYEAEIRKLTKELRI